MKKAIFAFGILLAMVMVSCQNSPESKLIGTWKVVDVETDFDANRTTPQMIKQVVDMQKQTFFKIINDSVMVIISTGNTYESKWKLNPEDQSISYTFDDWDENTTPFTLGIYDGKQIVSESEMAMGQMIVHFEKE